MNENKFYVYAHFKGNTQKDMFYIGKGSAGRDISKHDRNKHWHNVVNKHGYNILRLYSNLVEAESLELEINLIELYRAMGHKLVNMTNGGDGISGMKFDEDSKAKMRIAKLGKPSPKKGKHYDIPAESRKAMGAHSIGVSPANKGTKLSSEKRKVLSDSHIGIPLAESTKRSMSIARLGKKKNEDHKQKIRESLIRYYASKK